MTSSVPRVARFTHSASSMPKTTRRNSSAVALYMWMVARCAPIRDSAVLAIRSSRAWVSTEMVTSSGTCPPVMSCRTKSKSVWEADGNPISISLYPRATSSSNIRILRFGVIGSIRAWLPSRRSVDSQRGALVMRLAGHVRSGTTTGSKAR